MNKLKHLEGLRGLAALLVFAHHIRHLFYKEAFERADEKIRAFPVPGFLQEFLVQLKNTFADGTLFVWVFWILSSYVLSIQLFRPRQDNKPVLFLSFIKRYLRLFIPIMASVLLVLIGMRLGWFFNDKAAAMLQESGQNGAWLNSFFQLDYSLSKVLNYIFFEVYFSYNFEQTFNPVLWSIQNEFLGSLFIFSLFGILAQHPKRFYAYLLLIPPLLWLHLYELLPFLLGYMLCDLDYSPDHHPLLEKMKHTGARIFQKPLWSFIAFFVLLSGSKVLLVYMAAENYLIYLVQSFIILYFALSNSWIRNFLSLKWVWMFGTVSFSFYLLHMLVIGSFSSYLMLYGLSPGYKVLIVALTFLVSLLISIPFYLFIDKFAIRLARKFADLFAKSFS